MALLLAVAGVAAAHAATLRTGDRAPNFSRPDLSHRQLTLAGYRGRVVLLNFWASWCEPCMAELPHFRAWQQQYGARGLQVVGVAMDDHQAPALAAYRKLRLNFPVVMGGVRLAERYGGIYGVPVTFLLDRQGRIRFIADGAANLPALQRAIVSLLAAARSRPAPGPHSPPASASRP